MSIPALPGLPGLPPALPGPTGPPALPPATVPQLHPGAARDFWREVTALAVLVLVGLSLPRPWGDRIAVLVLAGYFAVHPDTFREIVDLVGSGLAQYSGG